MIGEGVAEEEAEAEPNEAEEAQASALWEYEPEPEILLGQLIPEYVNISVYRALLESAASELGARMTAMRNAAENAENDHGRPDPGNEPGQAVRDHAGDPRGRRRRRGAWDKRVSNDQAKEAMSESNGSERGTCRAGDRRRRRRLLSRAAAGDLLGADDRDRGRRGRRADQPGLRGAAAPRRRPCPRGRDGRHRRPQARRPRRRHRRPDHGPGRRRDAGPDLQPARRADRPGRRAQGRRALADPPAGTLRLGPGPDPGDPRDRDQGHRPARPLRERRQGRAVRRRRRRQDGPDPGADPQHRRGARRPLRVRRRRRALARGKRPLARDERVGRASRRRCSSSAR